MNDAPPAGRSATAVAGRAAAILGEDGPIARALPGFSVRPQQQAMAERIEETLLELGTLLCEAGTGTGKTLAYLVPCLDINRKTIISTATKTLQDQLFERDIPLVQRALGVTASVALLKGRANYLCLQRLESAFGAPELMPHEHAQLDTIARWARHTASGDISLAEDLPDDAVVWSHVTSTVDNCLGQSCPRFDDCFVVKARREAVKSDVVVVNHHLLFADMVLREEGFAELLPSAGAVILDEAHQIPDIASKFFGISLSSHQLRDLCQDVARGAVEEAADMPELRECVTALEQRTADIVIGIRRLGPRGDWAAVTRSDAVPDALVALDGALARLRDALEIASDRGVQCENGYNRVLRVHARLKLFLDQDETIDAEWIRWFESTARGATLQATPVTVAEPFQAMIESYAAAWIFTSATLSVNGDFSHFRRELGIEDPGEATWESPFHYADQGYLLLPRFDLEPRDPAYNDAVVELAVPLLEAARGRTFMLFTSYNALAMCADRLRHRVEFPLLVQGDAPRASLLRQFDELGNAVLLGTATFWQGIDVRGPGLSCVIIDKLPFAPPDDPVTRARIAALKKNGVNAFTQYQVPEAVIALKQGAGRLIRDDRDSGVLVLCDPRVETKGYGRQFLRALPPLKRTHDVAEAAAFLRSI